MKKDVCEIFIEIEAKEGQVSYENRGIGGAKLPNTKKCRQIVFIYSCFDKDFTVTGEKPPGEKLI